MPPLDYKPEPKETIIPVQQDYFIWWLFKHKCIMCRKPATEINEIAPRSRSKKNIHDWTNRVTLCQGCHKEYHLHGVTKVKMDAMREKRKEFLKSIDREIYVNAWVNA